MLENSSREDKHECPFGRSSIELTKMLCEILKVGELRKLTLVSHTGMTLGRHPASRVVPGLTQRILEVLCMGNPRGPSILWFRFAVYVFLHVCPGSKHY